MDNVVLTSACQLTEESGVPLNAPLNPRTTTEPEAEPESVPATDTPIENSPEPLPVSEPVEQTDVDGNFQARMDINYQAHDVALASAKANGHEHTNGLKAEPPHQKLDMNDGFDHPEKVKPCWLMLNKLFLATAIVCFALFLGAMALFVSNRGVNVRALGKNMFSTSSSVSDGFSNDPDFNITSRDTDGMIIVLSRRGASVKDILIPYKDSNNQKQYRSIVLKGDQFGVVRFGFDGDANTLTMNNQLPEDYPFSNFHRDEWSVFRELRTPHSARFVNDIVEVTYEFSSRSNELMMKTIVSPKMNEEIVADPTNNIYFNLRGHGDLSTHYLTVSPFTAYDVQTSDLNDQQKFGSDQSVSQLTDAKNYFYKLSRAGIGKQFIGTLTENSTKTKLSIFADHSGMTIDPSGIVLGNENMTISDMHGIRLSPRQSPIYQTRSIYGPIVVAYPSQAIHTTWWKFEY